MQRVRGERRQHQKLVADQLGFDARENHPLASQVRTIQGVADILSLPVDMEGVGTLQDADGNPYFMLGFSAIDGGDPLA